MADCIRSLDRTALWPAIKSKPAPHPCSKTGRAKRLQRNQKERDKQRQKPMWLRKEEPGGKDSQKKYKSKLGRAPLMRGSEKVLSTARGALLCPKKGR